MMNNLLGNILVVLAISAWNTFSMIDDVSDDFDEGVYFENV